MAVLAHTRRELRFASRGAHVAAGRHHPGVLIALSPCPSGVLPPDRGRERPDGGYPAAPTAAEPACYGTLPAPVAVEVRDQVLGPLLGEEEPCLVDLDDLARAGDQVPQVVGPLDVEIRVPGAPDQQGRRLEGAQLGAGGRDVGGVERGDQPLELAGALDGPGYPVDIVRPRVPGGPVRVLVVRDRGRLTRSAGSRRARLSAAPACPAVAAR